MRLATLRLRDRTVAVRVDEGSLVELGHPDVGALLAAGGLAAAATAMSRSLEQPLRWVQEPKGAPSRPRRHPGCAAVK